MIKKKVLNSLFLCHNVLIPSILGKFSVLKVFDGNLWLTIVTVPTAPGGVFREACPPFESRHCLVTILTLFYCFFQEEQPIYDAFSQEEFLSKFISFLSLEDRKGKDKFNVHRFVLFKVR